MNNKTVSAETFF